MVKELTEALPKAYKSGDAKMIRRILVLLDYSRGVCLDTIASKHGIARSSINVWLKQLLVKGLASLKPHWKGGRRCKLTKSQKKQLCEWIKAGPQAAGLLVRSVSARVDMATIWRVIQCPLCL